MKQANFYPLPSMSILQQFLNLQFIKTDEAGAVEGLEKVVSKLVKQLSKQRHKIIAYTLVALDPNVKDDDPTIQEVDELIVKEWRTFKNSASKNKDKPVTYIRAVILEALVKLAEELEVAALIWHSGRNVVGRFSLDRERDLVKSFMTGISEQVFSASTGHWSGSSRILLPKISITNAEVPNVDSSVIKSEDLVKHLKAALVYSGWAGEAGGGENPSYQHQGNWQWSKFASERAAKGLAEEINKAVAKQDSHISKSTNSIAVSFSNLSKELPTFFKRFTESIFDGIEANERQAKLLWWKESMYSPALRRGYRTLPELEAIFAMAIDYSQMVSPIYPESIDYFLTETLRDLIGDKAYQKISFQHLVEEFKSLSSDAKKMLESFSLETEGRVPLSAAILKNGLKEKVQAVEFLPLCGIRENFQLSRAEFLLWLFHDAQALKLANPK